MTGVLIKEEFWTQIVTEGRPCEDKGKWISTSQGEMPQKKPILLTPWSWYSSLQNCGKIHFYCLSHPVCGSSSKLLHPPKYVSKVRHRDVTHRCLGNTIWAAPCWHVACPAASLIWAAASPLRRKESHVVIVLPSGLSVMHILCPFHLYHQKLPFP